MIHLYPTLVDLARHSVEHLDAHPVGGQLVAGTLSPARYAAYLVQVAQQIKASGPLLRAAGQQLERRGRHRLSTLLLGKGDEEDGHDQWACDDLAELGVSRQRVEMVPESPAVAAYHAYCRYLVELAPAGVLGLAWILEWFGRCRAGRAADNLVAMNRIPASAVRFLRGHADADHAHVEALAKVLQQIDDPTEVDAILLAARVTSALYIGFFDWAALPAAAEWLPNEGAPA